MRLFYKDGKFCIRHRTVSPAGRVFNKTEEFDTPEARDCWLDKYDSRGGNMVMSQNQCREFADCQQLAIKAGVPLHKLVKAGIQKYHIRDVTFREAHELWMMQKETEGLREGTLVRYGYLGNLGFPPNASVKDLTTEHARMALRPAWLGTISHMWDWFVENRFATENIIKSLPKVKRDAPETRILTPANIKKMLQWGWDRNLKWFLRTLAIQAFAGLRTGESLDYIITESEHFHVQAHISKSRRNRYVKIMPNLKEWLKVLPDASGPVDLHQWNKHVGLAFKECNIKRQRNILRHSFASYHLDYYRDSVETSMQLGHASQDLLYRNYRALVKPGSSKEYFALTPDAFR